jgi:Ni/Co efflux regulator RcnB
MRKLFMLAMVAAFSMAVAAPVYAQAPATEKKAEDKMEKKDAKKAEKAEKKDAKKAEKKDAKKDAANPCAAKAEKK